MTALSTAAVRDGALVAAIFLHKLRPAYFPYSRLRQDWSGAGKACGWDFIETPPFCMSIG